MKAIYQRYRGWFDVNPARLWPHPPAELSRRYVEAIGGMDRIVELAQVAHDEGDFRWAATVLDHAVFTDEKHSGARELHADTLEQLADEARARRQLQIEICERIIDHELSKLKLPGT